MGLYSEEELETKLPVKTTGSALAEIDTELPEGVRISDIVCRELVRQAIGMMNYSYAPYSHFTVGAALLAKNNTVYTGCNIENASYTPTNCAERTAFFKAVSEGVKSFAAIAIVGGSEGVIEDFCPPCGVCRQVMAEFCDPDKFVIILAKSEEDYRLFTLRELLPLSFTPANLDR